MNRLDEYPEFELTSEIERSGKVGMYIILFCFIALALIVAGYFVSKPVTDNTTPVAGLTTGTDSDLLPVEAQIEFDDESIESASAEDAAVEVVAEEIAAAETTAEEVAAEEIAGSETTAEAVGSEEVAVAEVDPEPIAADESEDVVADVPVEDEPAESETTAVQDLAIEDVFDNGLIFVSASEPKYLITADQRRLDLGDEVDEDTLLAGITNENVILERQGNFIVIDLPDPQSE